MATGRCSREVDQHLYKLSKPSESDSEASVPSVTKEAFCSQGINNGLIVVDLDRIRGKYRLPPGFSLAIPSGDAHSRQPGFMTIYEDTLIASLRLPLCPLSRDLLIFLGIDPGQLDLNGWRFLMGAIHLWPQMFGYELTFQEFV